MDTTSTARHYLQTSQEEMATVVCVIKACGMMWTDLRAMTLKQRGNNDIFVL